MSIDEVATYRRFEVQTLWQIVFVHTIFARDEQHAAEMVLKEGSGGKQREYGPKLSGIVATEMGDGYASNRNMFEEMGAERARAKDEPGSNGNHVVSISKVEIPEGGAA